jgi:6-pyruvoyltetrahydropterin/6-carboxytetrahydropterin synthase
MPEATLTRRYRFSASHRLHTPVLSEDQNRETYGKCNNPFGHGHDYVLDVSVRGPVDIRIGRVMPVPQLDEFVRRVLLEPMDRRDLNGEIEEFAALVPTTENLAAVALNRLERGWEHAFAGSTARLEKVRIYETPRNIIELFASNARGAKSKAADRAARGVER